MSATRTYSPLPPMIPAEDVFCADPYDPREPDPRPHTYGVRVGLCAAFATNPCRPTACISAAPFRHTPCRFRPRHTTVWRSLQQHPQCADTTTTLHSPFSILNSSFSHTFSAKERDPETGLSYFGARYYSSDLSIWLSVDPMSGKYPSLSPYTYCADNPVRLVDPNGEDIIFVNERTGEINVLTLPFGKDILLCHHSSRRHNKFASKELSGNGVFRKALNGVVKGTLLTGMTQKDTKDVFDFMSDNTNVEWGFLEIKNDNGTNSYMVGTSHSFDTEAQVYGMAMAAKEGSVLRYDHSHAKSNNPGALDYAPSTPQTAAKPQYVDTDAWNDLMNRNPSVSLGIRYDGKTNTFVSEGKVTEVYPFLRKFIK